jgi:hypothetical protein
MHADFNHKSLEIVIVTRPRHVLGLDSGAADRAPQRQGWQRQRSRSTQLPDPAGATSNMSTRAAEG